MKPVVSPGACIAVQLSARRFGACRITGVHKDRPIAEIVDWFGDEPPTPEAVRRAKRFVLAKETLGIEKGPLRYVIMDAPTRLPKGFSVVGREPKVVRAGATPHLGLWWADFRRAVIVASATRDKGNPEKALRRDDERDAREAAKRAGLTPKLWRLREDAREVAQMWRDEEYDNVKDVVSDLVDLVPKVAASLPKEAAALERVRRGVLRDVAELAKMPEFAAEAKAWSRSLARLAPKG